MAVAFDECCGQGCNNCILDRLISTEKSSNGTTNLFNEKGYQKFMVKNIHKVRRNVYVFTFKICGHGRELKPDQRLWAPPLSYLMLRAKKNFEDEKNVNELFLDDLGDHDDSKSGDMEKLGSKFSTQNRFDKGTPGEYFSRKYTPFEVIVKLEKFGMMSRYLSMLHIEDVCEFKGPFESFKYVHEEIENYIVITQGISIVSAFRLVKEIIYESAQSRVLVISCLRNINETFLREDFFKLTHFWCLKHHMYLSQQVQPEQLPRSGENFHYERLTLLNFKGLIEELKFFDPVYTQILISGREEFINSSKEIVTLSNYDKVAVI